MDKDYDAMALTIWAEVQQCPGSRPIEFSRRLRAAMEAEGMAVWIRPDHLYKARQAPYLCRVEPTQRMSDFVPLFTRPAPPAAPEQETCKQLLGAALRRLQELGDTTFTFPAAPVTAGMVMVPQLLVKALLLAMDSTRPEAEVRKDYIRLREEANKYRAVLAASQEQKP